MVKVGVSRADEAKQSQSQLLRNKSLLHPSLSLSLSVALSLSILQLSLSLLCSSFHLNLDLAAHSFFNDTHCTRSLLPSSPPVSPASPRAGFQYFHLVFMSFTLVLSSEVRQHFLCIYFLNRCTLKQADQYSFYFRH